jgi:hypothetical protein
MLPRPFRFESIWFSHIDFLSVVEKALVTPVLNCQPPLIYLLALCLIETNLSLVTFFIGKNVFLQG